MFIEVMPISLGELRIASPNNGDSITLFYTVFVFLLFFAILSEIIYVSTIMRSSIFLFVCFRFIDQPDSCCFFPLFSGIFRDPQ